MAKSIYYGAEGDDTMDKAVKNARKTFKFFLREFSWEKRRIIPGLDLAAVKIAFKTDKKPWFGQAPETEHMWVQNVVFDGKIIAGQLLNKAKWVKGKRAGSPGGGPIDVMTDWMYVINGRVYGGFSIDAMRQSMDPAERAGHDAAWGLEFGEPGTILLAPGQRTDEEGESAIDDAPENAYTMERRSELAGISHPMDINMRDSLKEALQQNPEMANETDELGMSLLHDEALAGNDQTIEVLLQNNADTSARNSHGQTPLDLAKLMGWPKVIGLLER